MQNSRRTLNLDVLNLNGCAVLMLGAKQCFTITAKIMALSSVWLISIVNKRRDASIYNFCDASTSESGQFDMWLS